MAIADPASGDVSLAQRRGEILRNLGLMDELDERDFDELVELAASLCGTPMGAMTLLDEETQLQKARVGLRGGRTMPVRESVCQYTIRGTDLLMVEDLSADQRFHSSERYQRDTSVRFYAGMPLTSVDGTAVGALCVMDTEPTTLNEQQQEALRILGRQLSNRIQLRERAHSMAVLVAQREREQEMFSAILNNVPVELYLKDKEGHLRFYNRKLARRFEISETEWLGKTSWELWDNEIASGIVREDEYVLRSGKPQEGFVELTERNGRKSFWKSTKVPCRDAAGEAMLACCSVDLTDQQERERHMQEMQDALEEANRKLNSLALTDALTGLWNRRAFDARLETSVIASQRSRQPMALAMIDVDNFKTVNDRFGHPCGDSVLRQIAGILNRVKRAEDVACRLGGEEFAVLLPGTTAEGALALCSRIRDAMHAFPWEKGLVTVSIGIAMCHENCASDGLVDAADAALYRAKREGKDRAIY